jgi:hypothetical protein
MHGYLLHPRGVQEEMGKERGMGNLRCSKPRAQGVDMSKEVISHTPIFYEDLTFKLLLQRLKNREERK